MSFLSILAKTFALALMHLHPWWAVLLWLLGAVADARVAGKVAWRNILFLQLATLVLGGVAALSCDYAAMRWKEGIPLFAKFLDWILTVCGLSAGSQGGQVAITTMAGPLEFAATLDGLALKIPVLFLVLSAIWLLWAEASLREIVRKLSTVLGILIAVALVRMAFVVVVANGLFEFASYESEELPWRPFMEEATGIWSYLPFLLAAGVILARNLPAPHEERSITAGYPPLIRWAAIPVVAALGLAIFWNPTGRMKTGRVVIASYHSQWSRSDRAYDREWYGADSGYNYAVMKRLLEKFYTVADAAGPLTSADLDGASVLIIYDPDRRFSKEEIGLVHGFVRAGGGLFVIGDHTNVFGSTSHINELSVPFGFRYRDDVVFDLDDDFHQVIDPPVFPNPFWHAIPFFKLRGPTSIQPTSLWTRCVYQVGHSKSVRAIYSVNNFYPPPHDDPKMRSGTFCVATASRYGSGRVAAWADSTVFSNFEIFYPGKYEYLLNTLQWLNHRSDALVGVGQRLAGALLGALLLALMIWRRDPRAWLALFLWVTMLLSAIRIGASILERKRAVFPKPIQPAEWVFFQASAADKGHHLRDFITEIPYDQRYEVFIQWVLRTGAFSAVDLLDHSEMPTLHGELKASGRAKTASALIVRTPADLPQLSQVSASSRGEPLLLMFASSISSEQALDGIKRAQIMSAASAEKVAASWAAGEISVDDQGRRVVVITNAERFSDQSMGLSEKVTPDPQQREKFNQAFQVIDTLFSHSE